MELFILLIVLAIFAETTISLIKNHKPLRSPSREKIYIDTSVLIDGRILNIAKTGFISNDMIILKSVLRELQLLADGKDADKRARARAGLDLIKELERVVHFNVEVVDDGEERVKVDEQLLKFAKENHGKILTMDFNLIKVASAEKIETLNINDLVLSLRNEFLPGEKVTIKIVEKGSNRGQGVGYLKDGTMVVVEHGAKKLGDTVVAELVKFHETSAGRMLFAKLTGARGFREAPQLANPLPPQPRNPQRQKPQA